MVLVSSDPPTNPLSASVAYLTVLHVTVDSLSDTLSGASEAPCTTGLKPPTAESIAIAERMDRRELVVIDISLIARRTQPERRPGLRLRTFEVAHKVSLCGSVLSITLAAMWPPSTSVG